MYFHCLIYFLFFTATYPDAAKACKMFIANSNYETDIQLGRGFRRKRKPGHLDSESSDKESEESDLNIDIKRKKRIQKSDTLDSWKKISNKSKTAIKAPPRVPLLLLEELKLSPDKITRQHIPQLIKQPTFSLSVAKDSGKNHTNSLQKIILQQEDKENKREIHKQVKQERQDKHKFKEKKYNLEKESSSPILSTRTVKQVDLSSLHTVPENLFTDKRKCIDKMVSPPVSDETYIPIKLSEFSSASTSSQSACHYVSNDNDNVINEEHEECSYVQSVLENTQSISMENEINSNNGEVSGSIR